MVVKGVKFTAYSETLPSLSFKVDSLFSSGLFWQLKSSKLKLTSTILFNIRRILKRNIGI